MSHKKQLTPKKDAEEEEDCLKCFTRTRSLTQENHCVTFLPTLMNSKSLKVMTMHKQNEQATSKLYL